MISISQHEAIIFLSGLSAATQILSKQTVEYHFRDGTEADLLNFNLLVRDSFIFNGYHSNVMEILNKYSAKYAK